MGIYHAKRETLGLVWYEVMMKSSKIRQPPSDSEILENQIPTITINHSHRQVSSLRDMKDLWYSISANYSNTVYFR